MNVHILTNFPHDSQTFLVIRTTASDKYSHLMLFQWILIIFDGPDDTLNTERATQTHNRTVTKQTLMQISNTDGHVKLQP